MDGDKLVLLIVDEPHGIRATKDLEDLVRSTLSRHFRSALLPLAPPHPTRYCRIRIIPQSLEEA